MHKFHVFLIAIIFLCTSCQNVLFDKESSEYSIVVDPAAGESVQMAATELQAWIQEVSGATLPIVGLNEGVVGKRLIVGSNNVSAQLLPDMQTPAESDDGVNWCSVGGDILLWGGAKRGTLYSVYSFLEEELGCRWYTSKVSVAPKRDRYAFSKLDHHETPSLQGRNTFYYDVLMNPLFSGRIRNNSEPLVGRDGQAIPFSTERFWAVHTFMWVVPPSVYFDEHPEYFSLIKGKRVPNEQLCLSNPDVLRITIESMRKAMQENPDNQIYSLTQNDNLNYCECPECQAIADQYGGQSGLMIWFVNQVADALKDEFPDKYIGTFAYQYTRHAPKGIKPRENVVIRLCSIECCLMHAYDECEQNKAFLQDLRDWSAIAPHLHIWDYTTAFTQYSLPVPNIMTAKSHIQDFVTNNALGMMEQGDYQTVCCELKELKAYLLAKLMWNCEADVDAIIQDFTEGYYGPAGQYIREYIEFEHKVLRREGMHTTCYPVFSYEMYNEEFIRGATEIFAKAKQAVADQPDYLARVETAEFPILLLRVEKLPIESYENGTIDEVKHIIERDGITKMAEFGDPSDDCRNYANKDDYMARHEEFVRFAAEKPWPAVATECGDPGIAYRYYEGNFMQTTEMLAKGKVMEEGVMPEISLPSEPEKDHFGYDFHGLFKIDTTGRYMLRLSSDDGAILYIDGREVLNMDGSHTTKMANVMLPLEAGLHDVRLVYFEDCEDQLLELTIQGKEAEAQPLQLSLNKQ